MSELLLLEAAANNDFESVEKLIDQGVDVNFQHSVNGWSALHWAIHRQHARITELLLRMGAKIDLKNKQGKTPLDYLKPDSSTIQSILEKHLNKPVESLNTAETSFIPNYIKNPAVSGELKRFIDDNYTNQIQQRGELQQLSQQVNQMSFQQPNQMEIDQDKEQLLIYKNQWEPEHVIGSVLFKPNDVLEHLLIKIKKELEIESPEKKWFKKMDDITIPISRPQYKKRMQEILKQSPKALLYKE